MRIGIVLSSTPGYSETFFKTKINGLTSNGFQVILFASGKRNPDLMCSQIRPYPVFQFLLFRILCVLLIVPFTFLRAMQPVLQFWKYERENGLTPVAVIKSIYLNAHILPTQVDWLHFGFATTALGRENVAMAIHAKMAVSFRGYDINVFPLKNPGCYTNLWKRVDQIHSISRYLLQRAYELGLPQQKPSYIITPALATPLNPKTDFELNDPVRILTVARLTWIKGLEYGIQAIAKLKKAGAKVRYTIVGGGPEYENLLAERDSLDLQNEVIFAGELTHAEAIEHMRESDIYIQPSINEGFCNAVVEAQAMGCLCVVSNVGALPENVVNKETGWLFPPRDSTTLAETILRIINMPRIDRLAISTKARQRVLELFQIQKHMESWNRFYHQKID